MKLTVVAEATSRVSELENSVADRRQNGWGEVMSCRQWGEAPKFYRFCRLVAAFIDFPTPLKKL